MSGGARRREQQGALAGVIAVLEAILARNGTLPVNVQLVVEGEEERGSRVLRGFLADGSSGLRPAAAVLFPSFSEWGGRPPRLYLGFKGIIHGELSCRGGAWGGPTAPIHSSNAAWLANPAVRLARAVAELTATPLDAAAAMRAAPDPNEATGAVDPVDVAASAGGGTADEMRRAGAARLTDTDRRLLGVLAERFDFDRELAIRHARRYADESPPVKRLERLMMASVLNVSRLCAGEEDAVASIPASATARIDIRLGPRANPQAVVDELNRRLAAPHLAGVALDIEDASPGVKYDRRDTAVEALVSTYRESASSRRSGPSGRAPRRPSRSRRSLPSS